METMDRQTVIELFVVGFVTAIAIATVITVEVRRYRNPKVYVAPGSMKNLYNQSPNIVFRALRRRFGQIKDKQQSPNPATLQLRVPPEILANGPLFQRDITNFDLTEIDETTRLSITDFVLHVLNFDPRGTFVRLNRTLRPGDLTEIAHRAYQTRSLVIAGPINCRHQWQPRQMSRNITLTETEYDRLVGMLAQDRGFIVLCIKHADFLNHLVTAAHDMTSLEANQIPLVFIPSQTQIGALIDLHKEFYPAELSNR